MKKPSTAIKGACGEHYVAAYLSGFDLIIAVPRAGIPGFDLLVSSDKGGHVIRLQVKTGAKYKGKYEGREIYLWRTSYAAIERSDDEFLWYAYVGLNGWPSKENLPEVFFIPNKDVVACLKECKAGNDWPCFWMYQDYAKKYKGELGLQSIFDALGT